MHAAQRHGCQVYVLLLLCLVAGVAAQPKTGQDRNSTVGVRNDVEFQQALQDPQVQHVVLLQDITLQPGNWQRKPGSRANTTADRNITISSQPPYNTLDFAFLGSNWLRLEAGVWLTINETVLKQARYGVGMQLDFLAPTAGTFLVLRNSIVVRHLCVESLDEPAAIELVPRIPGFPGQQKAHYAAEYCLLDRCFDKVLIYDSFTKLSTSTTDTAAGGYGLAMLNVTRVCLAYAEQCTDSLVAESCMQRALDALPLASQTPGRIQAAAEAAKAAAEAEQDQRRQRATLAGAISAGAGAFLLLMLLLGLLIRHRRSLRRSSSDAKAGKAPLPVFQPPGSPRPPGSLAGLDKTMGKDPQAAAAGEGALGWYPSQDVGVVMDQPGSCTTRSSQSSRHVSQPGGMDSVQEQMAGPPSLQDQWELVAWKTSSHSLKRLPGQQLLLSHGVSDLASSLDSGQLGNSLSKELSSRDLILQGTGATTTQAVASANKIHMGVCIGAGSFGKVYRAKWRGADVAVKVVHHSQAAAVSVANEVDLMLSFQHPNLVAGYHFVTWRRRKKLEERAHNSDQMLSPVHQVSHSSGSLSLSCGNLAAATPPSGLHLQDDDMQTYIVQEFCDAGNLQDYCIIHGPRQEGQLPTGHEMLRLLFRLREVASGMQFLHDVASVVHGDLKSSNILLCIAPTAAYGRTAKVADFGLARVYAAGETHKSTRTLGTVNHMSPEMLRYGKASAAADVYSFGIMMWELLTGQVAFRGWQWGAILEHVALSDGRPPLPEGAPEDFVLLMESCWHKDPAKRPAFTEVVKCLSIMITSRQQELIEQAAGVTLRTHTVTAALSTTAAALDRVEPLLSNSSAGFSQNSTGGTAVQLSAATAATNSSVDEWDIVRVGSMRQHVSGASVSTSRSSPTAGAPAGSAVYSSSGTGLLQPPQSGVWRDSQPQAQSCRQQQQQQQQARLQPPAAPPHAQQTLPPPQQQL